MSPLTRPDLRRAAALVTLAIAAGLSMPVRAEAQRGGMSPMLGHGMQHMLEKIGASAEQRAQVEQIAAEARKDLRAQHEQASDLRGQAMQLFSQPAVDAGAVEVLRQQMLARHDLASQRMMQAMLDVSSVLTVEQRQQVATLMKARAEKRQRHERKHREHRRERADRAER